MKNISNLDAPLGVTSKESVLATAGPSREVLVGMVQKINTLLESCRVPGLMRISVPARSIQEICPDAPRGGLGGGGPVWRALVDAFHREGDWTIFYEEVQPGQRGEDHIVFS